MDLTNIRYRYTLTRIFDGAPYPFNDDDIGTLCWIMLNPSTADDELDDQTVRKISTITRRHGYSALTVVNLFAARATKPKYLKQMADPSGPDSDMHVSVALEEAHAVVCAWGARDLRWSTQPESMFERLRGLPWFMPILCCGLTADGSPKHPCRLPNDTTLIPFEVPR